jgi:hypothetical protein
MNIGILSPTQPRGAKPSQFTDKESAEFLVQIMAAERISRKVIRVFAADSPFRQIKPAKMHFIPERLPFGEIPGVKYRPVDLRQRRNMVVLPALTQIWLRNYCAQVLQAS